MFTLYVLSKPKINKIILVSQLRHRYTKKFGLNAVPIQHSHRRVYALKNNFKVISIMLINLYHKFKL